MPIVRSETTYLHAEAIKSMPRNLEIRNNISIDDVEKSTIIENSNALKISFNFSSDYNQKSAYLQVKGYVIFIDSSENIEKIEAEWKKNNQLTQEVMLEVGNFALMKSQMQSILLAHELGLQSPVKLPALQAKSEEA